MKRRTLFSVALALVVAASACSPEASTKQVVDVVVQPSGQIKRDGKVITQQEFLDLIAQANAGKITLGILDEPVNGKTPHPRRGVVKIGIVNAPLIKD